MKLDTELATELIAQWIYLIWFGWLDQFNSGNK